MSEVIIRQGQFPHIDHLQVGDTVTLTITGRVRKIEEELIDISTSSGPREYTPGERIITISLTSTQEIA